MYFGLADAQHSQNEKKKEDFLLGIGAAHLLFGLVWLRLL
jgi:hypothetical protein